MYNEKRISKPRETFVVECIMLEYYLAEMKG